MPPSIRRAIQALGKPGFPAREVGWIMLYFRPKTMLTELISLLNRRIAIIADLAWRDRDAAGHLDALKEISEQLTAWTLANRSSLDAQLRHYLSNASFQKALAHAESIAVHESAGETQ